MRPRPTRLPLFLGLTLLAGVLATPSIRAACPMEEIRVTVLVVVATDKDKIIDPALKCLADEVRKKKPHLTGFQQDHQIGKSVAVGKEEVFELIEKQSAVITVKHGPNFKNWVCLKVKSPGVGEITYTAICGKYFPLVTEYKTKDQKTLILAICIEPCKPKE